MATGFERVRRPVRVRRPAPARRAGLGERAARARRAGLADLAAVLAAGALVLAAARAGWALLDAHTDIFLGWPPLFATWAPHLGPGTPAAAAVAVLVVVRGPALAERLRWPVLLLAGYASAVAWTLALALVDGWRTGVAGRLATDDEYLHDVPRAPDIPALLRTFADHILTSAIDPAHRDFWTTHVGAHPPGAFLVFLGLDRLGLGGGGAAGLAVVLVGSSACVAVAVALRALGAEAVARRALPFGVLFPGAVWVGVSADGLFAAAVAWGVALLAVGAGGRGVRADSASVAGGLLLGYSLYLSYGLALAGLLPAAALAALSPPSRRWRAALLAGGGAVAVVAAFTASGFWWFTGYQDVRLIYTASIARARPYGYFVWADLAALLVVLGPAVVAGLRRLAAAPRGTPPAVPLLAGAALLAILLADLSGMSKAEVERIWLPFAVWLVPACALLPRRWAWLAAQAVPALAVNHLLLTAW